MGICTAEQRLVGRFFSAHKEHLLHQMVAAISAELLLPVLLILPVGVFLAVATLAFTQLARREMTGSSVCAAPEHADGLPSRIAGSLDDGRIEHLWLGEGVVVRLCRHSDGLGVPLLILAESVDKRVPSDV